MRPAMLGDLRVDERAAMRVEPRERPLLVRPDQARIAGDIGGEDRGEAAGRGHRSGSPLGREDPVVVAQLAIIPATHSA